VAERVTATRPGAWPEVLTCHVCGARGLHTLNRVTTCGPHREQLEAPSAKA
jgi:hypothetical protein